MEVNNGQLPPLPITPYNYKGVARGSTCTGLPLSIIDTQAALTARVAPTENTTIKDRGDNW